MLVSTSLRAKITDFGTIRQTLQGATASTSLSDVAGGLSLDQLSNLTFDDLSMTMTAAVGTPLYMAPELLKGSHARSRYGNKADVFSFGVLMWEVFTQRLPDLLQETKAKASGPLLPALLRFLEGGERLTFDDGNRTFPRCCLSILCVCAFVCLCAGTTGPDAYIVSLPCDWEPVCLFFFQSHLDGTRPFTTRALSSSLSSGQRSPSSWRRSPSASELVTFSNLDKFFFDALLGSVFRFVLFSSCCHVLLVFLPDMMNTVECDR